MSRRHNDLNVLCLSAELIGPEVQDKIIRTWLATPFEGGRHARQFVGRDRHPHACAAQQDSTIDGSGTHPAGNIRRHVGVVDGLFPIGTAVDDLVAEPFQQPDQPPPRRHTPMVAADCNPHESRHSLSLAGRPAAVTGITRSAVRSRV
jgi:hypothetical protein